MDSCRRSATGRLGGVSLARYRFDQDQPAAVERVGAGGYGRRRGARSPAASCAPPACWILRHGTPARERTEWYTPMRPWNTPSKSPLPPDRSSVDDRYHVKPKFTTTATCRSEVSVALSSDRLRESGRGTDGAARAVLLQQPGGPYEPWLPDPPAVCRRPQRPGAPERPTHPPVVSRQTSITSALGRRYQRIGTKRYFTAEDNVLFHPTDREHRLGGRAGSILIGCTHWSLRRYERVPVDGRGILTACYQI